MSISFRLVFVFVVAALVLPPALTGAPSTSSLNPQEFHLRMAQNTGPGIVNGRPAKRPTLSGHVEARFRGEIYAAGRQGAGTTVVAGTNVQVNQDFSDRPQNETSVAVNPTRPKNIIVGMNDYRIGTPVGGGFAASDDAGLTWVDGLTPFPLLANDGGIIEPPAGTGDPVVDFQSDGTAVYASIGFSFTWCNNGVFVYRSENGGKTWTRPVVPAFAPPKGLRTVTYWDKATDCSVFHDKEWMVIDRTGGPHDGRIYVTWSKFEFDESGSYLRSGINLAYSDNDGDTFTEVGEINGSNAALCTFQADGEPAGRCDENQFSVPIVLPDGTLVVAFENEQNESLWESSSEFDDQYLVVRINPDTFAIDGPYKAAGIEDGLEDLPLNNPVDFRQSICEANFRLNSAGNIFRNPATGKLHIVFMQHRKNHDKYPFPTFVNSTQVPTVSSECPSSVPETDTDVFMVTSLDNGKTWSKPAKVGERTSNDQWFPWGAASETGRIFVVYFDRRRDSDNKYVHAFMSVSNDSGANWNDFRVSSKKSNMDYAFSGGRFIGDYNGIAAARGKVYPVWTDARNGTATVRHSDIFTSLVNK